MSEKIAALIEEVKGLTVVELAELVHALEDTFGVSAAAAAVAAPAAAAEAVARAKRSSCSPFSGVLIFASFCFFSSRNFSFSRANCFLVSSIKSLFSIQSK